jgi:hypothetical protein
MAEKLGMGATFPDLAMEIVGGGSLRVPSELGGKYGVVLFYRGHW